MPTTCRARPTSRTSSAARSASADKIMVVQDTFGKVFNEGTEFQRDGSQFDALFKDGDTYMIGGMRPSPCTRPATRRPAWCM
jgi:hypothetical protein